MKVYCINRATTYGFSLYELEVYGTASGARLALTSPTSNEAEELAIYPNPATNQLTVRLGQYGPAGASLTLANNVGQVVSRQAVLGPQGTVALAGLPAGLYVLTISGAAGQVSRKVFISN